MQFWSNERKAALVGVLVMACASSAAAQSAADGSGASPNGGGLASWIPAEADTTTVYGTAAYELRLPTGTVATHQTIASPEGPVDMVVVWAANSAGERHPGAFVAIAWHESGIVAPGATASATASDVLVLLRDSVLSSTRGSVGEASLIDCAVAGQTASCETMRLSGDGVSAQLTLRAVAIGDGMLTVSELLPDDVSQSTLASVASLLTSPTTP